MLSAPSFLDVQLKWYSILATLGFRDIEDTTKEDRPLKKWTGDSLIENTQTTAEATAWPERVFAKQEELLHHPDFDSFCKALCVHGNCSLTPMQISTIWQMHVEGKPCRTIGSILSISYVTVHRVERKLTEWSMLIENR